MSTSNAPQVTSDSNAAISIIAGPGVEIFLVDHAFRLVAQGIGVLRASVVPGLYKVRCRAVNVIKEEVVEIAPDDDGRTFKFEDIPFVSSAPLGRTAQTHEYHVDAAQSESKRVHVARSGDAQIFVMARDWTGHVPQSMPEPLDPATGLTLHDLTGTQLVDFSSDGKRNLRPDAWTACTVALPAGAYRLRSQSKRWGPLEQIIIAASGWQTQVFIVRRPTLGDIAEGSSRTLDRNAASILMSRVGHGFDPNARTLELAEVAQLGLSRGRVSVSSAVLTGTSALNDMLNLKYDDPMLGIYGAYALAADPNVDLSKLARVIQNCRRLVGNHVDLDALAVRLGPAQARHTFDVPPMLAAGWRLVLHGCQVGTAFVPKDGLASNASCFLWGDGAWTMWRSAELMDEMPSQARSIQRGDADSTDKKLDLLRQRVRRRARRELSVMTESLTDLEAALVDVVAGSSTPGAAKSQNVPAIAKELHLPPSAVPPLVSTVLTKLDPPRRAGAPTTTRSSV
jgi:hypothetical protein